MQTIIMYVVGAIVLGGGALGWLAYHDAQVLKTERAAVRSEAVKLVVKRDKIDAKKKTATPADVCRVLGGKWVPDAPTPCGD